MREPKPRFGETIRFASISLDLDWFALGLDGIGFGFVFLRSLHSLYGYHSRGFEVAKHIFCCIFWHIIAYFCIFFCILMHICWIFFAEPHKILLIDTHKAYVANMKKKVKFWIWIRFCTSLFIWIRSSFLPLVCTPLVSVQHFRHKSSAR